MVEQAEILARNEDLIQSVVLLSKAYGRKIASPVEVRKRFGILPLIIQEGQGTSILSILCISWQYSKSEGDM
jgi:hypothetical protein